MQTYMSRQKGGAGIEPEGALADQATMRFRSVMQEKKEQKHQKKTAGFLYAACMFLLMVVLVIGITMINNYDRMSDMEDAIYRLTETLQDTPEENVDLESAAEEENREFLEAESDLENADDVKMAEDFATPDESEEPEPTDDEPEEEAAVEVFAPVETTSQPQKYKVKTGDTLNQICRDYYGNMDMVQTVCIWNGLDDGDKIYVGQTIELP
jgi:LysM repeat protein